MPGVLRAALATSMLTCTAVHAQTSQVWAGGDTVSAPAIQGEYTLLADPSINLNFAPVGGTAAQTAFLNQDQAALGGTAGGPVHFALGYQDVTPAQIAAWNATMAPKAGNLIQLPAFATAIAIPFTYKYFRAMELKDADLCGIFSGQVTDWSKLTGTVSPSQKKYPLTGPITVAVHAELTHETLFLTRHLAAVCTPANSAINFTETDNFSSLFPGGLPSNFVSVSSSAAMQAAMTGSSALTNAIGYLDAAFTPYYPNAPESSSSILVAKIYNAVRGFAFYPSQSWLIAARKYAGPGATNATVPANEADQTQWIPKSPTPSEGYSIFGYMTVLMAQCYSDPAAGVGIVDEMFNSYMAVGLPPLVDAGFESVPSLYDVPINRVFLAKVPHSPASTDATSLRIGVAGVTNSKATGYSFPCATKAGL